MHYARSRGMAGTRAARWSAATKRTSGAAGSIAHEGLRRHSSTRLVYTPSRNGKLRLLPDYLATTPDPDRGWALAALTGDLDLRHAKPALIRALVAERVDPVLFALSYDYVGDLAETVALIWPERPGANRRARAGRGGRATWRRARQAPTCPACSPAGSTRSTPPAAGRC